jgi:hypothetical protein
MWRAPRKRAPNRGETAVAANTMGAMSSRRRLLGAPGVLVLGLCAGLALGGCGSSGTKTVSVAAAPESTQSTPTSTQPTTTTTKTTKTATTPAPSPTTTTPTGGGGGTAAPTTTHTAPEPAFTEQESHAEGVSAASELVRARGYTPNSTSEYHENQTLRVLVGTKTGSAEGYGQQAFFFVDGRYLGTDTKEPSATVKVLSQSDTEVTLAYPLYSAGDALSSPSGQTTVRFVLNNGKLTPVGTIPPASARN